AGGWQLERDITSVLSTARLHQGCAGLPSQGRGSSLPGRSVWTGALSGVWIGAPSGGWITAGAGAGGDANCVRWPNNAELPSNRAIANSQLAKILPPILSQGALNEARMPRGAAVSQRAATPAPAGNCQRSDGFPKAIANPIAAPSSGAAIMTINVRMAPLDSKAAAGSTQQIGATSAISVR